MIWLVAGSAKGENEHSLPSEALLWPAHSTAAPLISYPPTYLAVSGTDAEGFLDARSSHSALHE